eukprot:1716829-Amphidinium_carterae.1
MISAYASPCNGRVVVVVSVGISPFASPRLVSQVEWTGVGHPPQMHVMHNWLTHTEWAAAHSA